MSNNVIVYSLWVSGREIDNRDQHYPIDPYNYENTHEWSTDFKKVVDGYFNAEVRDSDSEQGKYSEIFEDYIVILFSIDINIEKFENMFDIDNEDVQDLIPYYVDYDFNTVAERISKFK